MATLFLHPDCKELQNIHPPELIRQRHNDSVNFRTFFFGSFIALTAGATAPASGGLTWRPLNEPGSGGWLTSLRPHPKNPAHLLLGGDMLGIGVSHDAGAQWTGGYGLHSWEIGDITFHPEEDNEVWAGTMSGPYVSRDGGMTWESKRQGLPEVSGGFYTAPIQRILFDPANTRRLLAFAGTYRGWQSPGSPKFGFVWQSLDGGETWSELAAIRAFRNITWADADRSWKRLYAVVQNQGVFTSEDRGKTWKAASAGLPADANIRMVAVHPQNGDTAWVAAGNHPPSKDSKELEPGGVYQTTDGGKNWKRTSQGLPTDKGTNANQTARFQAIAVSPVDPRHLATSDTSWNNDAVYHSADGGLTWTRVLDKKRYPEIGVAYPAGMGATVITFDPVQAGTFYVANSETVLRTTDRGATWTDITASLSTPGTNTAWSGHGYSGLCSTRVIFNPFRSGSAILTAMDAGKHIRSDDNLQSWFFYQNGFSQPWGGGNDAAFAAPEGKIVYLAVGQHGGQGAIARSDDGGLTWREFKGASQGLPGNAEATAVHCDPTQPDRAWAVMGGTLFATTDGGENWSKFKDISGVTTLGKVAGAAFPFYVGCKAGVLVTQDGRTFELLPDSPASPSRIHVTASAPGRPYAVRHRTEDAGVYHWNGTAWKQIFKNSHAYDIAVHPAHPNRMAVATHDDPYHDRSRASGVWITDDGGTTWNQANDGLSCLRGKAIAFDPHQPDRLLFGSFGRGFFQALWPDATALGSHP
jgi:photosystem II stability/assembly factor-like uncharacterized protein